MTPYVRKDVAEILAMMAQNPRPSLRELGPANARDAMREMAKLFDLPTGELALIKDFDARRRDGGVIPARLFDARADRTESPIVLYFHGGGFVFGDLDTHGPVCAEIARQLDLPVLAVDYRLAPEHPWPDAQHDCVDVACWLTHDPHAIGIAPTGLVLCGDSAGGWLAIVVASMLLQEGAALPLHALGLIYPLVDMNCARYESFRECATGYTLTADSMNWFVECFQPDKSDPLSDLLSCIPPDLPPTVTISASLDPLRDQGRAFAATLARSGGTSIHLEAKGQVHGFIGSRRAIPSARVDLSNFLEMLTSTIELSRTHLDVQT